MNDAEDDRVWESLGLLAKDGDALDAKLDLDELQMAATDPLVASGLRPGADIPALVRSVENQLHEVESASVADFVREGESLSKLHVDMVKCGKTLDDMESTLVGYAKQLAELSEEIRRLQNGTTTAAARVSSRSAAEAHLSAFIDEVIIPPSAITTIVEGDVGQDNYSSQLALLDKKIAFMELEDTKASVAHGEVKPQLDQLLLKAVQKVKAFLHEKVALLRRPNTNVQIIKENVLLKNKTLFEFLMDHSFTAYVEVRDDYVDTMSKLYNVLFQRYIQGLMSLKEDAGARGELLVESSSFGSSFRLGLDFSFTGKSQPAKNSFAIGDRLESLKKIDAPAVILAVAANSKSKLMFEEIQRSIVRLLLETCTSEHMYCAELFGAGQGRMFDDLFSYTVDQIYLNLQQHVAHTQDAVGVLLTMKIHEVQREEMRRRKVRDLNNFFTRADILLKPRYKEIFDENLNSLTSANPKSLFPGQNNLSPHIVSRRYAEFAGATLGITMLGSEDDMIKESLKRLRTAYQGLMNRISLEFKSSKNRYTFLINNCDLVLTIFEELEVHGEDELFFQDLLSGHVMAFAEHELAEHFPDYLSFVRSRTLPDKKKVRSILREFAVNWRSSVAHIRENVLRVFPNFKNGSEILKSVLTQLVYYHKKAESIVEDSYPELKGEMVTSTAITYEIRQDNQKTF